MVMFVCFGNEAGGGGQCHFDDDDGKVSQVDKKRMWEMIKKTSINKG